MKKNQTESEKMFRAIGIFKKTFNSYIISLLSGQLGQEWSLSFIDVLSLQQKDRWVRDIQNGKDPENLIDFQHYKSFAINNKELLHSDFGFKKNSLPTWLGEIVEVRNKIAHQEEVSQDDQSKFWIHLRTIAKIIGESAIEQILLNLEEDQEVEEPKIRPKSLSQVASASEVFLKTLVSRFPSLSLKKNVGEFRVSKSGLKGSLWIKTRYEGFRIQTTGELVTKLDYKIMAISGREVGVNNKDYKYWHIDDFDQFKEIIEVYSEL